VRLYRLGSKFTACLAVYMAGCCLVVSQDDAKAQADLTSAPASNIVIPKASQPALESAQQLVQDFASAKTLPQMALCLTDNAAGLQGVVVSYGIDLGVYVQASNPKGDAALQSDYNAYLKSYGLTSDPKQGFSSFEPIIPVNGRQFLSGLGAFFDRLRAEPPVPGMTSSYDLDNNIPSDPGQYEFKLIDANDVLITPLDSSVLQLPGYNALKAVVEGGEWRLEFVKGPPSPKAVAEKAEADARKQISDLALNHDVVGIKALLSQHPEVINAKDLLGDTALFTAVAFNYPKTCEFLIDHGADVNVVNNVGESILDKAMLFNNQEIVHVLLKHGARHHKMH